MRARHVLVAVAVITLLVGACPGQALAVVGPPPWPAGGRSPQCEGASLIAFGPSGYQIRYADGSAPRVLSITAPKTVVIGPRSSGSLRVRVRVDDLCSGARFALLTARAMGQYQQLTLPPATTDAFHQVFEGVVGAITPKTGPIAIRFQDVLAWDRYESFVLDENARIVSAVPRGSPAATPAGTYAGPAVTTYVLAQSGVTAKASATSVRRGATVRVGGRVTWWSGASFQPHGFVPVSLQARVGSGPWRRVATKKADGFGDFSFPVRVSARTALRVVYAPAPATLYAPATSPVRVVAVR